MLTTGQNSLLANPSDASYSDSQGRLRVLFLAAGLESPSVRFRLLQYLPYLRAQGIIVETGELASAATERRRLYAHAAAFDVVLVHRALLPPVEHWLLRHYARRVVFEFDDAIMFRDSAHRSMRSWRRMGRFRRMARGANSVIAGSDYLKSWAEQVNPNTVVIPTSIELSDYPVLLPDRNTPDNPSPVIGWIGTRSNLMYLETLRGALAQVGQAAQTQQDRFPRLKVVCDSFPNIQGITLERKIWTLAEEPDDVRSFQIGIMPLPDDIWARGKCGLKILQYMAASVPVVCSPVGVNEIIVKDGVNGFLAKTEAEWVDCLKRLLADGALRTRIGQAGRAAVEADYSMTVNAPKFISALLR